MSLSQPAAARRQHANTQVGGGQFRRLIAQKADELQRNRIAAVNEELATDPTDRCRVETAPACNGSVNAVADSVTNGQRSFPLLVDHTNQHGSDVLRKHCHRGLNSVPASVSLPGKTSGSVKSEVSELGDLVILPPPPPDFADGANVSVAESTAAPSSLDMAPSPPPEFSDGPPPSRRVDGDFRRRPVATWSVSDVARWLDGLQLSGHRDSFAAQSVDGRRLVALGRAELIALGVSQVGQRMNLERAIKRAVMSVPSASV